MTSEVQKGIQKWVPGDENCKSET